MRYGQSSLTLVLLASAAALGFGLLSQQPRKPLDLPLQSTSTAALNQAATGQQTGTAEAPPEPAALEEFVEMTSRPLFSTTRRPPQQEAPQGDPDPQPQTPVNNLLTNQFAVTGIVISGDEKVALLKRLHGGNDVLRVQEGQKVSDWTVAEIRPGTVTLQQNGVTELVSLKDNVLSAAQKQKLLQQAKLEQAQAMKRQLSGSERARLNNSRRFDRRYSRQNRTRAVQQKDIPPPPPVRTPVR